MTHPLRVLVALLGLAFTAMVVWASIRGDFGAEFQALFAMPWGRVSVADLYLGFVLYAVAVFAVEERKGVAALWALPIFIIGNAWACAWVAVRWPVIAARLRRPPPQ